MPSALLAIVALGLQGPAVQPVEYEGQQVYRTSHALLVADSVPPEGEPAFGNSVHELAKTLIDTCSFPAQNVRIVDGSSATVDSVRAEIRRLEDPKRVSRQDRVLIVFAVHGTVKDKAGYFVLRGKDALLPMREIADAVLESDKGIPAKHVLMLADSCHAGSIASNAPVVGADPDATLSDLFKRPYRGIWAGANSGGRAFSDDSTQSTKMIGAIVSSLTKPDTYPMDLAGASDVLYQSKQFVPITYTPQAEGAFVFALKGGSTPAPSTTLGSPQQQIQVRRDRSQAEALSYEYAQKVIETEKALGLADKAKDARGWGLAQTAVGRAYIDLPTGTIEKNLRAAILAFTDALTVFDEQKTPAEWSDSMDGMGVAYRNMPTGSKAANHAKAIECYESALKVRTESATPEPWATTMGNMGIAYWDMPTGDREANIAKAIECFEASLRVFTKSRSADGWAKTMNRLGAAYSESPSGNRAENLVKAADCYQNSLAFYTEKAYPRDWAQTMGNMGIVYTDLCNLVKDEAKKQEYAQKSLESYEAALSVFTKEAFPQNWASTTANLGACYAAMPGDKAANLAKAVSCYTDTLGVFTKEAAPQRWAATISNIGACYSMDPTEANIAKAIENYDLSLDVYSESAFPEDWARTMLNLGKAYTSKPSGDRASNLAKAVESCQASLRVYTDELPWQRCEALYSLAKAVHFQGDRGKAKGLLEECLRVATQCRRREYAEKASKAMASGFTG